MCGGESQCSLALVTSNKQNAHKLLAQKHKESFFFRTSSQEVKYHQPIDVNLRWVLGSLFPLPAIIAGPTTPPSWASLVFITFQHGTLKLQSHLMLS
jgi:hypothetical protein